MGAWRSADSLVRVFRDLGQWTRGQGCPRSVRESALEPRNAFRVTRFLKLGVNESNSSKILDPRLRYVFSVAQGNSPSQSARGLAQSKTLRGSETPPRWSFSARHRPVIQ